MAGKKPAKRNVSNNQKEVKKELAGKAILYKGYKGHEFSCPSCTRRLVKGIVWEDSGSLYCSRLCIPKQNEAAV
jgi:hypothetical protein